VPRWREWLWKIPLYFALAGAVGGISFVWWQHDDMVREQYELRLIDTQPHVGATFDRHEPGERGSSGRAWVSVKGESKELMDLVGVALLEPGQSITVVENPGASWLVVPVYARDDLAAQFRLYPRMLDDTEMWAYQLTIPVTWMAGGMLGAVSVALIALQEWLRSGTPSGNLKGSASPNDHARGASADGRATLGTGRSTSRGVISLGFAAVVGFLVAVKAGSANPWGMTAAAVWIVTLVASGINYLMPRQNLVVSKATNLGYLIGFLVLVGWTQARPEDLASSRSPTAASVRITGLVLGAVVLVAVGLSLQRRLRARAVSRPSVATAMGRPTFISARTGYDPADVDDLLAQIAALPDTPEGRDEARTRIEAAKFHLSKGPGYEPLQVDQYLEQLVERYAEVSDHPHPRPLPEAPPGTSHLG